ncbi:hypothetical protein JD844_001047 [Phrynosoma platyrhinos]|uniref:Receptor ligand binding region domain-containing protein n=1 Tax=Phrynosoma platyrhinos TaxID=52577 RepID=A0ABQ7T9W6_PHRPL|nr:hypothetical protein JD844_001047 [Phrynosoma platyrhinos]
MPREVMRDNMETPRHFAAPSTARRIQPTKRASWPDNYHGPVGFTDPPIPLNIKPKKEAKEPEKTPNIMDFIGDTSELECDCRCNLKAILQKKKVPDTPQSSDEPDGADLLNPATQMEEPMEEGDCDPPQPSHVDESMETDSGYHSAMLSFGSFDPALKDKVQFPSVYRMIPNERAQYVGIVKLLKHFGWTWIGLIVSEDDSGEVLLRTLVPWLLQSSICFAFKEIIPKIKENWIASVEETGEIHYKVARMQSILSSTDTNVILVHGDSQSMLVLQLILIFHEIYEKKPIEKVWIITAQWDFTSIFYIDSFTPKSFNGTLSFALPTKKIEGYAQYLSTINPTEHHDYVGAVLWTSAFRCSFPQYDFYVINATNCTGEEKLSSLPESVFDMGMSGQSYVIYNAVYAIAHALHAMLSSRSKHKGGRDGGTWNLQNIHPWQLHSFLKHIHFNNSAGEEIFFDENGELGTGYDILNTVTFHNWSIHSSHVGWSDPRAPEGKDFLIHQNSILWNHKFIQRCKDALKNVAALRTCENLIAAFWTMDLLFTGDGNPSNYICKRKYKLMAVIGGLSSHNSRQMPHILNICKMAQVGFFSYKNKAVIWRVKGNDSF